MSVLDNHGEAVKELHAAWAEAETFRSALQESLMLQSHYAVLLNRFDAGERMTFPTVKSWLDRLRMIGKLPKDKP